jgi:hypothetical protein
VKNVQGRPGIAAPRHGARIIVTASAPGGNTPELSVGLQVCWRWRGGGYRWRGSVAIMPQTLHITIVKRSLPP